MRFLDGEQRNAVGFNYIIDSLNIITPFGKEEKKNIKPFKRDQEDLLKREFEITETIFESKKKNSDVFNHLSRQFMKLKDITNTLKKCQKGECLDEVELFEIKIFSMISQEIKGLMCELDIQEEEFDMMDLEGVIEVLDPEGRRMPTFHLYEDYSDELKDIRDSKRNIEHKIYTEKSSQERDTLKEQRLEIVVREKDEEWRIRKNLSGELKILMDRVIENTRIIGRLDFIISKVDIFAQYKGVRPEISKDGEFVIVNGMNPQVVDIIKGKNKGEFTPINISLSDGSTIITGANMGGKSITLKTVVLNALLMQSGFYVFADEASIPLMDFIYMISDDLQSVSKGLSTFGAEIIALKSITESVKRGNGLVAFDEFARGTNPFEGGKLVRAVAEFFQKTSSISLFATHYDGVVNGDMVHYQVKGLKNVDFQALSRRIGLQKNKSVDIIQEHMDYGLELMNEEQVVPKDALNIAKLLGIDQDITIKIEELYSEEEK